MYKAKTILIVLVVIFLAVSGCDKPKSTIADDTTPKPTIADGTILSFEKTSVQQIFNGTYRQQQTRKKLYQLTREQLPTPPAILT